MKPREEWEVMVKPRVDLVIPSYNNMEWLHRCVSSIFSFTGGDYRITVINNGEQCLHFEGAQAGFHQSLVPGENLKWTNAINYARDHTDAEFLCMMNDDTQVPDHDSGWLHRLLQPFKNDKVAAVGPISNYAMGYQSIINVGQFPAHYQKFIAPALSGFCCIVRRSVLDELDWLDASFQDGAEDVDLSLRIREAGYELVVCRDVFIYHAGSVTAGREYGHWWNSNQYSLEQRMKIMRKHGVRKYYEMTGKAYITPLEHDKGRELLRDYLSEDMKGLDLGCGPFKIHDKAVGVDIDMDRIQYGRYAGHPSQADVRCDITDGLPFEDCSQDYVVASHFLEHVTDVIAVLDECFRVLKPGGRLLVTMPSQNKIDVMPLDSTHLHAYSPESFHRLLTRTNAWEFERVEDVSPGYNFICVAFRPPRGVEMEWRSNQVPLESVSPS